jgi:hypothetical protein
MDSTEITPNPESRQSHGQAIADAVERYCLARELNASIDEHKAALAREIDELVKFCVESCPCNVD